MNILNYKFALNLDKPGYSKKRCQFRKVSVLSMVLSSVVITLAGCGGGYQNQAADVVAHGGRLYENWILESGSVAPEEKNPVWALQSSLDEKADKAREAGATWLCMNCHGPDYKGVNGVYGDENSPYYTGFPGLLGANKTKAELVDTITNGFFMPAEGRNIHDFGNLLSAESIDALAQFIMDGVVDTAEYIRSPLIVGPIENFANGQAIYTRGEATNIGCAICHGEDGRSLPLLSVTAGDGVESRKKDDKDDRDDKNKYEQNLRRIALEEPWRFVHVLRFGSPGSVMPAMTQAVNEIGVSVFEFQDAIDVAQYVQSFAEDNKDKK